ncbi:MAG TPA: symmetrical bis(5'-nucleosyl)-tetraphosphatase [Quisquiliibacterium sp.]|nr:symmetrical bis(5'-nucleosyl)-tetraphosphatase [Quisquiliibacterium sp.]
MMNASLAATVAIGDVQGCFDCLEALLAQVDAAAPDGARPRLWLAGDLVNRGPKSLETLRWAMANEHRLVTVLGNHDLHLLALAAGIRPAHRSDTLDAILTAPDRAQLLDWLRRRPLAHLEQDTLLVHAGVLPQWSAQRAVALAAEVQRVLSGPDWAAFLRVMYGNQPARWDDRLEGADRLRLIVNAFTRLRFCSAEGTMEFATKEGAGGAPRGYLPWFDVPGRASADVTVVFGHWSTLGLLNRPRLLALDTGCVWGGALTGVRLGDRRRYQVGCPQAQMPRIKSG